MGRQRGGHIRVLGLTEKEHELAAGNMAAVFANAGFFFFCLCYTACGILVHGPGIQPTLAALEARCLKPLNHQGSPCRVLSELDRTFPNI